MSHALILEIIDKNYFSTRRERLLFYSYKGAEINRTRGTAETDDVKIFICRRGDWDTIRGLSVDRVFCMNFYPTQDELREFWRRIIMRQGKIFVYGFQIYPKPQEAPSD